MFNFGAHGFKNSKQISNILQVKQEGKTSKEDIILKVIRSITYFFIEKNNSFVSP